jgi:hypothetical protein
MAVALFFADAISFVFRCSPAARIVRDVHSLIRDGMIADVIQSPQQKREGNGAFDCFQPGD